MELDLEPGTSILHGGNGHGKSNLLEALYLLAVAKSPRALADRELIGFGPAYDDQSHPEGQTHTGISALVNRSGETVRVQIDLLGSAPDPSLVQPVDHGPLANPKVQPQIQPKVQKVIRVNGAPRRAVDLVGEVNVVLFTAQDLELVYGPPSVRRRYLDVLISQHDRSYLRALQRYQRALTQRNHLLKSIRAGRSNPNELDVWDERVSEDGGYIIAGRARSMDELRSHAATIYHELAAGAQALEIGYQSSLSDAGLADDRIAPGDAAAASAALATALAASVGRDTAQGFTSVGPHRDDVRLRIGGADAARYASRGQARSGVLALKLAEAEYLSERRGETPVILLDDVLSELDPQRRDLVLDRTSGYDQCLVTTAEPDVIGPERRASMRLYEVRNGTVTAAAP